MKIETYKKFGNNWIIKDGETIAMCTSDENADMICAALSTRPPIDEVANEMESESLHLRRNGFAEVASTLMSWVRRLRSSIGRDVQEGEVRKSPLEKWPCDTCVGAEDKEERVCPICKWRRPYVDTKQ